MTKRKFARIAGLTTTVVAASALIAGLVGSTGAYFTQAKPGQIAGTNGNIAITVSGGGGGGLLDFDFTGILPGQTKTANITVNNTTVNPESVWIVFDNTNGMWSAVNNLGQFGKFTVGGYIYDNLANRSVPPTPGVAGAPTGTFMSYPGCETVARVPQNYLPHAVRIATLAPATTAGDSVTFPVTFTYNPCMTNHQGESIFNAAGNDIGGAGGSAVAAAPGPLKFNMVAFQDGVDPTSPFNGAAAISPLNLVSYNLSTYQYIQY